MIRRFVPFIAVSVLVTAALGVTASTVAAQTQTSKTFESGLDYMQPWYDIDRVARTSATSHSGDWSLAVDGQDFWGIEETWPGQHQVTPGASYEFSGWVKVSAGGTQKVYVTAFFVAADGTRSTTEQVDVVDTVPSRWTRYTGTVTAPDWAATVGFRYEGPNATRFYLDDVRTTLASGGEPEPEPTDTSQPSPKPTKTTTPSSPEPTEPSTPQGGRCTDPDIVFEGWEATGLGEYYADAGMWNSSGYDITQTMGVCSHDSWYVDVTATDHQDNAVLSYPNIHRDWHNWSTGDEPRIDSFTEIRSSFAHDAPGSGIWNVAYDIWVNGVGNGPGVTELMIWTENSGQRPAGSRVGTVAVDGHDWVLWATGDDEIISFVATTPLTSGQLDLKAFMQHLMDTGRLAPDSTLGQIGYGVEIVSTHGEQAHFDFTHFTATAS